MTRNMLLRDLAIAINASVAGLYWGRESPWVSACFFLTTALLIFTGYLQILSGEKQMQNRSNQPKDAPLSREQAINVQRELERQKRKHENHEMMRRGTFRPNMRNSKRGRKK